MPADAQTVDGSDPFHAMQRLLRDVGEPIIFDVGAYDGQVTLLFRSLFPTASIYSFEPFAESFKSLWLNSVADQKIQVFNYGLSDAAGIRKFHSNKHAVTNSLLPTDAEAGNTWAPNVVDTVDIVECEFRTIDQVMDELKIPRIDLLKLDVQGAEYKVMAGAAKACRAGEIRLVYSELITQPTYVGQKRFDDALRVFYDSGFDLYQIYNMSTMADGRLRQVDAIFDRK